MSKELDQEVVSGVLVLCFLAGLASGLISIAYGGFPFIFFVFLLICIKS
jgi:asparagine N-glycosylation enzyme membrane subunit Stt3